jgi:hypothetical protein
MELKICSSLLLSTYITEGHISSYQFVTIRESHRLVSEGVASVVKLNPYGCNLIPAIKGEDFFLKEGLIYPKGWTYEEAVFSTFLTEKNGKVFYEGDIPFHFSDEEKNAVYAAFESSEKQVRFARHETRHDCNGPSWSHSSWSEKIGSIGVRFQ